MKILHRSQQGNVHMIRELEVETILNLDSNKEYEDNDNSQVIATDSQRNTIYILAKLHGLPSAPEEFGLRLATHFLEHYPWVTTAT